MQCRRAYSAGGSPPKEEYGLVLALSSEMRKAAVFGVMCLALSLCPGLAEAHLCRSAQWLNRPVLSPLSPLPRLLKEVEPFLSGPHISNEVKLLISESLNWERLKVLNLDPKTRERLQLDARWGAVAIPNESVQIRKSRILGTSLANDSIQLDKNSLDKSQAYIAVSDITPDMAHDHFRQGWVVQKLFHELAHVHLYRKMDASISFLESHLPQDLFRKEAGQYLMHPELYDYLGELYALTMGYRALYEYYRHHHLSPSFPVHFKAPDGSRKTYLLTSTNYRNTARTIAIEIYGISDPTVLKLVDSGLLEKLLNTEIPKTF